MTTASLTSDERALLDSARRATLGTIGEDGRPRLVPVCFVLVGEALFTPIDEKPKATADPRDLARIRDIERRSDVTILVDRWDEDWTRLAWLRIDGQATLVEPDASILAGLRAKYPQYRDHDLERRPLIRIAILRTRSWPAVSDRGTGRPPPGAGSGSSSSPGGTRPR
ncbi:MAG TPA: TIGR03668 family PPOX class F420-dependent oxidoreductase [Clostridia bacterium]|nr:TIGR03668 family PPOX class F420-dependent oxidoreductase [Clostridia bacterium]